MELSSAQRQLLREMGAEVWRLREPGQARAGESVATTVSISEPELSQALSPEQPITQDDSKGIPEQQDNHPETLDLIRAEVQACERCGLQQDRTQTVFGMGDPQAEWLFIGEAPGFHEDQQGEPFVGAAGQLLTKMIAALNMTREQVYIANVLKCRPPKNRDPSFQEVTHCEPYLHRQIALIQPKVIVALGKVAGQALLKSDQSLGRLRAHVHHYGPLNTPLVVTYHPAYLLRTPQDKRKTWEDLQLAQRTVAEA